MKKWDEKIQSPAYFWFFNLKLCMDFSHEIFAKQIIISNWVIVIKQS